jgi:ParB family chromosome partitioning protein
MNRGMAQPVHIESLEISQLDLRYAHTRIKRPEAILSLMRSLDRWGQIRPVSVAASDPASRILVDGYLRVEALRRCGKDAVLAEVWLCGELQALVQVLMRGQERRWDAIEEASVIRELHERHGLSQEKIAGLLGKDKSWVCRRLTLLSSLPEEVLEAVHSGSLSAWAAGRVLAPVARANAEHAKALARALSHERLCTRDLVELFRHYQQANRRQRERMTLDPVLFLKALRAKEEESRTRSLKEDPEGKWLKDMKTAGHILARLAKTLPSVIYPGQRNLDRRLLLTAFEEARETFVSLQQSIERRLIDYGRQGRCASHPEPEGEGRRDKGDLPASPCLPKHGSQGAAGGGTSKTAESFPL